LAKAVTNHATSHIFDITKQKKRLRQYPKLLAQIGCRNNTRDPVVVSPHKYVLMSYDDGNGLKNGRVGSDFMMCVVK